MEIVSEDSSCKSYRGSRTNSEVSFFSLLFEFWIRFGRFKRAFRAWQFSLERIRRRQTSVQTAMVHQANLALLRRCVHRWRQYINEQEFEREIESKVDLTWAKVQDWLI